MGYMDSLFDTITELRDAGELEPVDERDDDTWDYFDDDSDVCDGYYE